jgi:ubiquinone/menaquinone biosynthesis C-methylase UbiE
MYKELRALSSGDDGGIRESTPEAWARNFAESKRLTLAKRVKIRADLRFALIRKYFKPGGNILDAGCGFGEWVTFLLERGYRAVGLDYSQTLINRLRSVYPRSEWIQGTIEKIPAADQSFDGLISWGVIEHNEDGPQEALAEFYRVLKPGGHAIVTVPYEDSTAIKSVVWDAKNTPSNAPRNFYCYYMTESDLRGFMAAAGFEVVEIDYSPPASLGKVLPQVYVGLGRFPKLRLLLIHAFGILFYWKRNWFYMMYAVGKRPE